MARKHRRSHRRSRSHKRSQHGGGAVLAPYNESSGYLLDAATRVQAGVGPLDRAFADIANRSAIGGAIGGSGSQMGGRRRRWSHRRSHRHLRRTMKHRRHRGTMKHQRGGALALADYKAPGMLLDSGAYSSAKDGTNPQFYTEGSVNSLYSFNKGAQ